MEKLKVGFLTFEYFHGRRKGSIGSTMIRVRWLIDMWKKAGPDIGEAEIYKIGEKYDVIVYQKVYDPPMAEIFNGKKILDICDPDWRHWGHRVKQTLDLCDAAVGATKPLAEYITNLMPDKPVWLIPDRVNFDKFIASKEHRGTGPTKTAIWYGFSDNFHALELAVDSIVELGLDLTVISNKPFNLPPSITKKIKLINYPWSNEHWQSDIQSGDVVINPKLKSGKWKYKSNNKTLNAWALGMPVAQNEAELKLLMTEEQRVAEVEKRLIEVRREWDIEKSVMEYKKLITSLYKTTKNN